MAQKSMVLALLGLLIVSLATIDQAKDVTLRLGMQADMEGEWLAPIIKDFEAAHPGVKVVYEPVPGAYNNKIPAAILGGTAPDVFQGWGENQRGWAQSGFLLDLEPYVKRNPNLAKDFFKAQWDALKINSGTKAGMRYGIPMYVNVLGGILYNADMFDQAGMIYPDKMPSWTWNDLLAVAKKLTRANGDQNDRFGFGTLTDNTGWLSTWMWAAGGALYADDGVTFTGLSANSLKGLQFVHDMIWQHGVMPPDIWADTVGGAPGGFLNGKLAMMQTYAVWTPQVADLAKFNWNIAPNPVGPAGIRGALTVTDSFSINAATKYPDEAFELILALTNRQANVARLKEGSIPSLPSLGIEYYKTMPNKNLRYYLEAMEFARVDPRTFFPKPVEMNAVFVDNWTKTNVQNLMSPAAGMESVANALKALAK